MFGTANGIGTDFPLETVGGAAFPMLIVTPEEAPEVWVDDTVRRVLLELSCRGEDVLVLVFDDEADILELDADRAEGDVKVPPVSSGLVFLLVVPMHSAVDRRLSPLVTLGASSTLLSSPVVFLLNVFQSHSNPWAFSHLALQPAPTPLTAALKLSCSLKTSQFA